MSIPAAYAGLKKPYDYAHLYTHLLTYQTDAFAEVRSGLCGIKHEASNRPSARTWSSVRDCMMCGVGIGNARREIT